MVQGISNTGYYGTNVYGNGVQGQGQEEAQSNGCGGTVGGTLGLIGGGAYMGFAHKYAMTGHDVANFSDEKFNKIIEGIKDDETKDSITELREDIKSVPDTVKEFTDALPKDAEGFVDVEHYKKALDVDGSTLEDSIKEHEKALEDKDLNKEIKEYLTHELDGLKQKQALIDNAKDGKIKLEDITKLETKIAKNSKIKDATLSLKALGKEAPKVKLFENFKDIGKLKKAGIAVAATAVITGLIGKLFNSDKKEAPAPEQTAEAPVAPQGQIPEGIPQAAPQAPAFAGAPVNQATMPIMPQQPIAALQGAVPQSPLDAPIGNPYAIKPGFCAQA